MANLKMKDFIVGTTYVPFDEVNSTLITRKIEKLKLNPGTGEWDKKFYYIHNASTNGICHPVYQDLFKTAKREFTDRDDCEVVSIGIPKSAKKNMGIAENLRVTFMWAGMKFDSASLVVIPGEKYVLPVPAASAIRRFLESKNLTPDTLGLHEDREGVFFLTDTSGREVEISDYEVSQLEY